MSIALLKVKALDSISHSELASLLDLFNIKSGLSHTEALIGLKKQLASVLLVERFVSFYLDFTTKTTSNCLNFSESTSP